MAARRKKELLEITSQTAQYITTQLDATEWQTLLEQHRYCKGCPARAGAQLLGTEIDSLCLYCPLRPLMLDLADLHLRSKRKMPPSEK